MYDKAADILQSVSLNFRIDILFQLQKMPDISTESLNKFIKVNINTLYYSLNLLKDAGLVKDTRDKRNANKKTYSLTPLGQNLTNFIFLHFPLS